MNAAAKMTSLVVMKQMSLWREGLGWFLSLGGLVCAFFVSTVILQVPFNWWFPKCVSVYFKNPDSARPRHHIRILPNNFVPTCLPVVPWGKWILCSSSTFLLGTLTFAVWLLSPSSIRTTWECMPSMQNTALPNVYLGRGLAWNGVVY